MYNHHALIGMNTRTNHDKNSLGVITDLYMEDGRHYIVLNDSWEQAITMAEVVIDLCSGKHFVRVSF